MKLFIQTQVLENYAWAENGNLGTGDKAYWKAKGGYTYSVLLPNVLTSDLVSLTVERARPQIETRNEMFVEFVIGWSVEADDFLTEFEQVQLEHDGSITYPTTEIRI